MNLDFEQIVSEHRKRNEVFAVATVVEVVGSTSAKTGSKVLIDAEGMVVTGWVGGGCAEASTCTEALDCMSTGQTSIIDIDMDDEVLGAGMPCGGHMRVFVQPEMTKPTVWIMGHGAVAEHLCVFAKQSGFLVVVNDPMAIVEKFPGANKLIVDDLDYEELTPSSLDYVVIATQHKGDHESMTRALNSDAAYIALIASRKRSRLVLDYLRGNGIDKAQLNRVVAPCGIDLGARTPVEIALSVISEIILVRRSGSGLRMKDTLDREHADGSTMNGNLSMLYGKEG